MRPLAFLVITLVLGADMVEVHDCEPPKAADAVAQVRVLNQGYIDAARTADVAWFGRHMNDDVVVILGSGERLKKSAFLSRLKEHPRSYKTLTVEGAELRVFGPTVQVDADAPWELADGTKGISRYIDTWAWIDCRWQVISAQINSLPRPTDSGENAQRGATS